MKIIRTLLSENFHFLVVKFSVYLNRHVFIMGGQYRRIPILLQISNVISIIHCDSYPEVFSVLLRE